MLPKYQKIKFTTGDKITESLGDRPFTIESAKGYDLKLKADTNEISVGTDGHVTLTDTAQIDFGVEGAYIRKENDDLVVSGNSDNVIIRAGDAEFTFNTDGELLDANGNPVAGGGVSGDPRLTIHGFLDGITVPGIAVNYVSFTTGDEPISALYLTKYVSVDNRAWFAIQVGPAWTASQIAITPAMVAYGHFGPNAQIVNQLGSNLLSTTNYTLLPNTTYTMWIQQINAQCEYAFSTSVNDKGGHIYETYSSIAASPTIKTIYTTIGQGPAVLAENTRLSNAELEGSTTHGQLIEAIQTKISAGLVTTHDFRTGSTWYHNSISQNFTPNFTNVPSNNDRVIQCKLILAQGSTPYIPNAVQINGNSQTINWLSSTVPTGTANKKELVTFTLIRTGSAWVVLGKLESYGPSA
jgi:RNase P/RNase MRP subunit p29